jgi:uncharacterized protein (DUF433 family)
MTEKSAAVVDLLARPVYDVGQVDRLLGLPPGTSRRWIDGYTRGGRAYPPVVRLEATGQDIVTWGEFTETRLLAEFRDAGVPMINLRPTVVKLREEFKIAYPLARAAPLLEPSGRELIWRVQQEVGLESALQLVVVRNNQILLSPQAQNYVSAAEFIGDIVTRIRPLVELDRVWFDPLRQFGEPAVRNVPTAVIAEQYRAGDRIDYIARAYELAEDDVEQAIRYELIKANAAAAA